MMAHVSNRNGPLEEGPALPPSPGPSTGLMARQPLGVRLGAKGHLRVSGSQAAVRLPAQDRTGAVWF